MKEKMSTMMDDDEDEDMKHCLTLRIWSLNTAMRGTLNDEHFQKGQQVDEWLRQASKDDHIIELVQRYGSRKWSAIAKYLPGRIGDMGFEGDCEGDRRCHRNSSRRQLMM
ncbi:hypothetical protein POM88_017489 [Heracleum sosnowskyi]|uniref:Myb-like domain-containing protein n=1 Tax=Heracleum sosnowskyi TaxID=360622 RepID=A0AAD8MY62_9APIA|nr:hypothetical protein POM88_017489 [Heracleum sosnowskyi]